MACDDLCLESFAAISDVGERCTYEDGTSDASSIQVNQESLVTNPLQGLTDSGAITVRSEGGAVFTNLQQGLAKAWVNFDGTTSGLTIRDSLNNSSMTDHTTGDYTTTFANAMGNAGFSCNTCAGTGTVTTQSQIQSLQGISTTSIRTLTDDGSAFDRTYVMKQSSGDLA